MSAMIAVSILGVPMLMILVVIVLSFARMMNSISNPLRTVTTTLPIPFGSWDSAGYWHPDYEAHLSPDEQKEFNEKIGLMCQRYSEVDLDADGDRFQR